jgi:N-acetylglucosaminyldiphosphoundecaprenol N-acetyl-beta-D-mannosaminyltransferase
MKMSIVGSLVDSVNYEQAANRILEWTRLSESGIVLAANVHMVMEAFDDDGFRRIVNSADLVVPDGIPLVWMLWLKGVPRPGRVYGPTLMLRVLEAAAREKVPVGFYGGRPEVLESLIRKLRADYPELRVAYSYSPPFRSLSSEEDAEIARELRSSEARILFVGLGCPKQEIWMAMHKAEFRAVMLGVGAAFDFHAGARRQAPSWMQSIGLEWLFRLAYEPRRLWRRYIYHNPRFIVLAIADLVGFLRI